MLVLACLGEVIQLNRVGPVKWSVLIGWLGCLGDKPCEARARMLPHPGPTQPVLEGAGQRRQGAHGWEKEENHETPLMPYDPRLC